MSSDADVLTKRRQSTGKEVHYFIAPTRETLEEAERDRRRWEAGDPELREKMEARRLDAEARAYEAAVARASHAQTGWRNRETAYSEVLALLALPLSGFRDWRASRPISPPPTLGQAWHAGAAYESVRLRKKVEVWATETELSAEHAVKLGRQREAERLYGAVEGYARVLALLAEPGEEPEDEPAKESGNPVRWCSDPNCGSFGFGNTCLCGKPLKLPADPKEPRT